MATKREEILGVLENASEPDIGVEHCNDTLHVKIKTHTGKVRCQETTGKWARFADEMHAASPLKGQSKQLNTLIRAFRDEPSPRYSRLGGNLVRMASFLHRSYR